jgi:phage-related minor tail protein
MMASYKSIGGVKGIFNMFTGMGRIDNSINTLVNSGGPGLPGFSLEAQGGVYDAGLRKFAKGGTFTNSVVNSPTMFKFAQGAGLMGEAGPEAIMPLKRDSNGNLGVRSDNNGGSKVDIVVNNYSSEKATTTETVDSKGNRKIEVIVGDMVADQLSRTGSAAQQALTGSYGQRPSMVRR